jgi:hypothetical protein
MVREIDRAFRRASALAANGKPVAHRGVEMSDSSRNSDDLQINCGRCGKPIPVRVEEIRGWTIECQACQTSKPHAAERGNAA